jgi:peroxiredoxin (alkyl hydroperoxide reductase subunit C)
MNPEIKRVPDVVFKTRVRDESVEGPNPYRWQDKTTADIFGGKNIVLFALPGAFTPTCSSTHAPGYEQHYEDFKALGVDEVICLSVNDAFVMFKWAKDLGIEKVFMLPDGNAEFTEPISLEVKTLYYLLCLELLLLHVLVRTRQVMNSTTKTLKLSVLTK